VASTKKTARDAILRSAMDLFHRRSYNAVSVNDICVHAGARKGSFYYHFESKAELGLAVLEARWTSLRENTIEVAFAKDLPPIGRLRRLFAMTRDYQAAHMDENRQVRGCPFGNMALELSGQKWPIQVRCQEVLREMVDYFESALVVGAGSDGRGRAEALVACYQGAIMLAKVHNDPAVIDSVLIAATSLASSPEFA
jgi:TetR/AcrR family transcriptional repressor of nem operon